MSCFKKVVASAVLVRCSQTCFIAATTCFVPVRGINIYKYTTKKKRIDEARVKSMKWAEPIFKEYEKKASAVQADAGSSANDEPHMLHVVYLIQQTRGRPWWEKKIIEQLQLEGPLHQPVILKNVPSINKLLAEVKHLVRIVPLRFPHGIPQHESDFEHAMIRSNGEMIVKKRLKEFEPPALPAIESQSDNEKWKLQQSTVIKELEKRLASFTINTEYFKPKYVYRRNQDGKEYRYTFNKDLPKYEW